MKIYLKMVFLANEFCRLCSYLKSRFSISYQMANVDETKGVCTREKIAYMYIGIYFSFNIYFMRLS